MAKPKPSNVHYLFADGEQARRTEALAKQRLQHKLQTLMLRAKAGYLIGEDPDTQAYWQCMAAGDRNGAKEVIKRVRERDGWTAVCALLNGESSPEVK